MSWGIWKKIKQGVAKVGGFVRNMLGGAPKAINNAVDTVNTIGKKAMKGVKRATKLVRQFEYDDDDVSTSDDEQDDTPPPPPPPKSKRKANKQIPRWRKLLDRREANSDDDEPTSDTNRFAVSYAGRRWMPKMKPMTRQRRRSAVVDDSEDMTD